nr:hypothetical protein [uncultured Shinella sp.]
MATKAGMTLEELIDRYRPHLVDESVAVRRSWEDVFKYTLRVYSKDTPVHAFDLNVLSDRLCSSGMHELMAAGYVKRWRELLARSSEL